ncbi:glycosyltransferase family 2 protein [Trabulsiella odontotermitis]|uniref:glycosyltransferase family 2 protein n=1 Tax=Trabulsiella odontotermitis TaxID=379893 RepID=UPI00092D27C2|nr:glycosyltransferase [Trabulsiella odontotermitis]
MMTTVLSIDVLISTYGPRVSQLFNVLHDIKENVRYVICHQNFESYPPDEALLNRPDVIYIKSDTRGVTKSRNILIKNSSADIIYFCDDDVTLSDSFDKILRAAHSEYSDDAILFNIRDEFGEYRKDYPREVLNKTRFNIMSVGTIEISIKGNHDPIFFPEDIGAGTELPIGDEAIYLSQFLNKKRTIRYVPHTIAIHPRESTGQEVSKVSIYSRGVALKRVFGRLSYPLALLFLFRRKNLFKTKEGILSAMVTFFSGVYRGK